MGRSVSQHRHAIETVFIHNLFEDGDADFEWECFMDDLKYLLQDKYPSLDDCNRWMDNEDHIILENRRGKISVSEYCGLVAVCLAPRDPDEPLDVGWCHTVARGFSALLNKSYDSLRSIGRFSNGEQVFERVNA